MYDGVVNIPQKQLNSFLALAEDLKVKGLTEENSESLKAKASPKKKSNKSLLHEPVRDPEVDDEIKEVFPGVKAEPALEIISSQSFKATSLTNVNYNVEPQNTLVDYEEEHEEENVFENLHDAGLDSTIEIDPNQGPSSFVHRLSNCYSCGFCGKEFRDQSNCRRHVKEKHFGQDKEYCPLCAKLLYKRHIQDHMKRCTMMS